MLRAWLCKLRPSLVSAAMAAGSIISREGLVNGNDMETVGLLTWHIKKYKMLGWSLFCVSTAQVVIIGPTCSWRSGALHGASAISSLMEWCSSFLSHFSPVFVLLLNELRSLAASSHSGLYFFVSAVVHIELARRFDAKDTLMFPLWETFFTNEKRL